MADTELTEDRRPKTDTYRSSVFGQFSIGRLTFVGLFVEGL